MVDLGVFYILFGLFATEKVLFKQCVDKLKTVGGFV